MFQCRHYEMIARVFARTRPRAQSNDRFYQWVLDRTVMADMFTANNPHFDRGRFILACEAEIAP